MEGFDRASHDVSRAWVQDSLIVELKSVERVLAIHEAQLLTYMKLARISTGLLINFNVPFLTDGLKRFVL